MAAIKNKYTGMTLLLLMAIVAFVYKSCIAQGMSQETWGKAVHARTVVRFFFLPANSYAHPPLIFRVVPKDDKRLGTAPIENMGGRTSFISIEEMHNLIQVLQYSGLAWQQSRSAKPVSPIPNKEKTDRMEISIFFTDHPTQAYISAANLCQTLSGLDKVFIQPRALWEFHLYRVEYGCSVRNFNRSAYPQHDDPKFDKE